MGDGDENGKAWIVNRRFWREFAGVAGSGFGLAAGLTAATGSCTAAMRWGSVNLINQIQMLESVLLGALVIIDLEFCPIFPKQNPLDRVGTSLGRVSSDTC